MKLSKCLLLMALPLTAIGCAQTSRTYYFGDVQSTPESGRATLPPPFLGADSTPPLPPGEPHLQAEPKTKSLAKSKSKSKHAQHYRHHTTHHSPHQKRYSQT